MVKKSFSNQKDYWSKNLVSGSKIHQDYIQRMLLISNEFRFRKIQKLQLEDEVVKETCVVKNLINPKKESK